MQYASSDRESGFFRFVNVKIVKRRLHELSVSHGEKIRRKVVSNEGREFIPFHSQTPSANARPHKKKDK